MCDLKSNLFFNNRIFLDENCNVLLPTICVHRILYRDKFVSFEREMKNMERYYYLLQHEIRKRVWCKWKAEEVIYDNCGNRIYKHSLIRNLGIINKMFRSTELISKPFQLSYVLIFHIHIHIHNINYSIIFVTFEIKTKLLNW